MLEPATVPAVTEQGVTGDDDGCWECGTDVPAFQLDHTRTVYRAAICTECEPWVRALLGPH
jgi:hypothetical protein